MDTTDCCSIRLSSLLLIIKHSAEPCGYAYFLHFINRGFLKIMFPSLVSDRRRTSRDVLLQEDTFRAKYFNVRRLGHNIWHTNVTRRFQVSIGNRTIMIDEHLLPLPSSINTTAVLIVIMLYVFCSWAPMI